METTKELILRLYERKDPKRRRLLFEHYQNLFDSRYSARFLVEMINTDLGAETVGSYDIKYVRSKASKWQTVSTTSSNNSQIMSTVPPIEAVKPGRARWSLDEPKPFTNPSEKIKP